MDIDQVIFGWSPHSLLGTRGVGPIASSLGQDLLGVWNHRLGSDIWAAADPPGSAAGLTYLCFEQEAAVLHKLPVADQDGRPGATLTHALLGPARLLTAALALGLAEWEGWRSDDRELPSDGRLARIPVGVLTPTEPELSPATIEQSAPLIANVLANPRQRFSVLASPVPATGVLQVLLDVLGDMGAAWTFATRESADPGASGPRVIFLTGDPGFSAHGGRRIRVDLGPAGLHQMPHADLVQTLLDGYRRGGAQLMAQFRPGQAAPDVAHWARTIQVAPGVLANPRFLLAQAGCGAMTLGERAYLASTEGRSFLAHALAAFGNDDIEALLADWKWNQTDPASHAAGTELLTEGLRRCLRGASPPPGVLRAVRQARPDGSLTRSVLRAQLGALGRGLSKPERNRLSVIMIAVAMLVDPTITLAELQLGRIVAKVSAAQILGYADLDPALRPELVRMVIDTASGRHRPDPAIRYQVERHGYFAPDAVKRWDKAAARMLAVLLELAYGPGIASNADDVRAVAAGLSRWERAAVRDPETVALASSAVLTAIGLRTSSESALRAVEHELAIRVIRAFEPAYCPSAGLRSDPPGFGDGMSHAGAVVGRLQGGFLKGYARRIPVIGRLWPGRRQSSPSP